MPVDANDKTHDVYTVISTHRHMQGYEHGYQHELIERKIDTTNISRDVNSHLS